MSNFLYREFFSFSNLQFFLAICRIGFHWMKQWFSYREDFTLIFINLCSRGVRETENWHPDEACLLEEISDKVTRKNINLFLYLHASLICIDNLCINLLRFVICEYDMIIIWIFIFFKFIDRLTDYDSLQSTHYRWKLF